jgi:hypothetical protein
LADDDGAWTLADQLEYLHDRSGVPIIADGYRVFASFDDPIEGGTVGEWLKNAYVYDPEKARVCVFWAIYRTEKGWLMAKDRQYWTHLDNELPERYIRPLEAKARAGQPLWVDDYAELASHLGPGGSFGDTVVHFNAHPIVGHGLSLRLWAQLSRGERRNAAHGGASVASMSPEAIATYLEYLRRDALFGLMDPKLIVSFLPGGPPLPDTMCLFYRDTREQGVTVLGADAPIHMRWGSLQVSSHPVEGCVFSFGVPNGPQVEDTVTLRDPTPAKRK